MQDFCDLNFCKSSAFKATSFRCASFYAEYESFKLEHSDKVTQLYDPNIYNFFQNKMWFMSLSIGRFSGGYAAPFFDKQKFYFCIHNIRIDYFIASVRLKHVQYEYMYESNLHFCVGDGRWIFDGHAQLSMINILSYQVLMPV